MHFLLALLLLSAPGSELQVETLSGTTYRGTLVELSDKQLKLATADKPVTVPVADLQRIRNEAAAESPPGEGIAIELLDGTQFVAPQYTVAHGTAHFKLLESDVELPTDKVRCARFKEQTPAQATEWSRIRQLDSAADLLVLRKNDRIDFAKGVLDDIDPQSIGFKLDNELIKVPRAKVEGLIYFHSSRLQLASAVAVVRASDGTAIQAQKLTLSDGKLQIVSPTGLKVALSLDRARQIDFAVDKIVYLSDLEPASIEWTPFFAAGRTAEPLSRMYRPRKDHALLTSDSSGDDGLLQLRYVEESGAAVVRSFAKGLAVHSRTKSTYALPDKYRRLKATVGIDARLASQGRARVVISGDGKELFAAQLAGGEVPRPVDLDITGVRKLTLLVDFGDASDAADYVDLCEARLVK